MRHIRALVLWISFPGILVWLLVVAIPLRVSRWVLTGGTAQQRTRRARRRAQQAADWAEIERAMVSELARRGWPDTALYRSILISGKWSRK